MKRSAPLWGHYSRKGRTDEPAARAERSMPQAVARTVPAS